MSDNPPYDPTPQPAPPPSSSKGLPPVLANLSDRTLLWIQAVAGVVAAISTFFPWLTISISFLGESASESHNGWGINSSFFTFLIFLLGLLVAALAIVKLFNIQIQGLDKLPAFLPLILAGALALLALVRWIDVISTGDPGFGVEASSGFGIWLVFLGSLAALGAALLPVLKARNS